MDNKQARILELLRQLKVAQAKERLLMGDLWSAKWDSHPRVFTGQYGQPLCPSIPGKHMKAILEKACLPYVTLHSLRHTIIRYNRIHAEAKPPGQNGNVIQREGASSAIAG